MKGKTGRYLVVVLILLVTSIVGKVYAIASWECTTAVCEHQCKQTGLMCDTINTCCGWCSNDGGQGKEFCCLRCGDRITP